VSVRGVWAAGVLGGCLLLLFASAAAGAEEQRIVFASKLPGYPPPANLNVEHLYSVRVDGSGRLDLGALTGWPSLSPDRRRVAFVRDGAAWTSRLDGGGGKKILAPRDGVFASVAWAPDGRRLVVVGSREVWLVAADGSAPERLLEADDHTSWESATWSPDGRRLAVESYSDARCGPSYRDCAEWLVDIVGPDGRRIATIADARNAAWSPDGRRLVLEEGQFVLEQSRIVIRTADGSRPREVWNSCSDCDGCWSYPTWSPKGDRIVFVSDDCNAVFEPGAAVVIRSTGRLRARTLQNVLSPSWSPDGRRFLFFRGCSRDRNGNDVACTLWSAAPDGTRPRKLVRASAFDDVTWSPDGKRMALVDVRDADGHGRIFTVDGSGRRRTVLTRDPATAIPSPFAWSRGRLLYKSVATQADDLELWTAAADGSSPQRLTSNTLDDSEPAWSPDHSKIAFVRTAVTSRGALVSSIFVVGADGRGERQLDGGSGHSDRSPTWSPDGRRVAFALIEGSATSATAIGIVGVEDGRLIRVPTGGRVQAPAWSPDGSWIAFSDGDSIDLIHPDGTGTRPLTKAGSYTDPAWSPDGTRLAVSSPAGVSLVSAADGSTRLLIPAPSASSPSWSPDGSLIVYADARSVDSCVFWNEVPTCPQKSVYSVAATGAAPVDLTPYSGVESLDPSWFTGGPK